MKKTISQNTHLKTIYSFIFLVIAIILLTIFNSQFVEAGTGGGEAGSTMDGGDFGGSGNFGGSNSVDHNGGGGDSNGSGDAGGCLYPILVAGSCSGRGGMSNCTYMCGDGGGASVPVPVNGSCSAAHYSCSAGTSISNSEAATNWAWACQGLNGGSNAACSENKPVTVSLSASPPTVDSGSVSTLQWTVSGATQSPNSCIPTGAWASAGPQPSSNGTHPANVWPVGTSVYGLTCYGPGGSGSGSTVVYTPSGSLDPRSCTIPPGGTSCNTYVSWNADHFLGSPKLLLGSNPVSNDTYNMSYPPGLAVPINPDNLTFTLKDSGGNFSITQDADAKCTQTGPSPEVWTGSFCAPLPIITIDAKPNLVRTGSTANVEVKVDSNFNLECKYSGGVNYTFNHTASAVPQPYSRSTVPLNSARVVRIECKSLTWPIITATKEARVSVVPVVQEI